jgi:hypothetical protein
MQGGRWGGGGAGREGGVGNGLLGEAVCCGRGVCYGLQVRCADSSRLFFLPSLTGGMTAASVNESKMRVTVVILFSSPSWVGLFVACRRQKTQQGALVDPSFLPSAGLSSSPQPASLNSSRYPPTH